MRRCSVCGEFMGSMDSRWEMSDWISASNDRVVVYNFHELCWRCMDRGLNRKRRNG
jgi:hypothetical protein